ncbi:hypothetical protein HHK36_016941 [Tetracentron sinense]|uniref:GTD-binding domain-containing protein n=1 Tax=Tetracentron sinense TaxID=13715 RepID=A0A834Z0F3_TETSI|nr:hypothetical protein HHK36_016941 [Tetracentron sinense]
MDSETSPPSIDSVKCCSCNCSCSLINSAWNRSVKRKFEEIEDGSRFVPSSFDYSSVARVEVENECVALRETLSSQQQSIQELYAELEEERNASSSAANEAMSMILRLQREKAEIQMESRQFKRFAEEKMAHDQQELVALDDMLYKREQAIQSLTCEVQAYKHRMMSFGFTEAEVEGDKGGHSRTQSMDENFDTQFEFPPYDYPPLKCNMHEMQGPPELDNDIADLEKYAFGDTPHAREHLQNLEYRIYQLETTPRSNQIDGEFSGRKSILEKAVVGQSPRRPGHDRRFSTDSSGSLVKETRQDCTTETPSPIDSFKKMEHSPHTTDYPNMRKVDNASDFGDDMNDRVYTIDSVHHGVPEPKAAIGICEDYVTTPREPLNRADVGDPDIKKLYMRLQVLEADRESMKQAIVSMRTDKAQLILLREIAQHLCKEMPPERRVIVKKPSLIGSFSFMSVLKWITSFVFWRKKACRSKVEECFVGLISKHGYRLGLIYCLNMPYFLIEAELKLHP